MQALQRAVRRRAQLAAQGGIRGIQQVIVTLGDQEQVAAVLDVAHARLPEQVEQVDRGHADIAHAVLGLRVPEHAVAGRAVAQFGIGIARIDLLEVRALQQHGQDA